MIIGNNTQQVPRNNIDPIRIRGIADLVFCIDGSKSMHSVFDGLISHIDKFIAELKSSQMLYTLDLRFGIVAHSWKAFYRLDFTDDITRFTDALRALKIMTKPWNEYTLPAIDYALDFNWRKATRIVIVLTDEPLSGGHEPDLQRRGLFELIRKIAELGIHMFFVGIDCPEYQTMLRAPSARGKLVNRSEKQQLFESNAFEDLIKTMGNTLSYTLKSQVKQQNTGNQIYDLSNITIKRLL